jgi:hypothetical protein
MPDRPDSALTLRQLPDASQAMLKDVQQPQHKSYLQTGVDSVLDATIGSNSSVGKELSRYTPSFLQTAALFTPGRYAFAASMAIGAANEARVGDSLEMQLTEFGMGAAKGAATKVLFDRVGNANIMKGALWSVPAKGVMLGVSGRAIDVGLTPQNWLNEQGNLDATQGLSRTLSTSLDPKSLAMDVLIFGAAHAGTSGINKLSGGFLDRSQAARNIVMGTTFGVTGGTTSELMAQSQRGGPYDWGEIAKRGLYQGIVDGVASAPGAIYGARSVPLAEAKPNGNGSSLKEKLADKTAEIKEHISDAVDSADDFGRKAGVVAAIGLSALEPTGSAHINNAPVEHTQIVSEHQVSGSDRFSTADYLDSLKSFKLIEVNAGERTVLREGLGAVRGAGKVELNGSGIFSLDVPEGQTLRVVYKGGEPTLTVSAESRGRIEIVNQYEKPLRMEGLRNADGSLKPNIEVLHPLADVFTAKEIADIEGIQAIHQEVAKRQPVVSDAEKQAISDKTYVPAKVQGGVLDIVVGPPGAGKTSNIVEPIAEKRGATIIDGDEINPLIPGYENGLGQVAVGGVSGEIRAMNLKRALENKDNIVLPFIGQKLPLMEQIIQDARAAGYTKIAVHYVEVPPEVSARRVYARSMEEPNAKGVRQVIDPEWALRRINDNVTKVFDELIQRPGYLDQFVHYFGDVPRGERFPVVRSSNPEMPKPWEPGFELH